MPRVNAKNDQRFRKLIILMSKNWGNQNYYAEKIIK